MNNIPLKCLLGLSDCNGVNPLEVVGVYVRWFEMLSLAGIVLAISQFIENDCLRTFILKRKRMLWPLYGLILFSILAVIFSTLLSVPLIPADPIPLISYPAFWELLGLLVFSLVLLVIILLSMFPWLFIPKFNKRNYQDILRIAAQAILYDGSDKAVAALCKIIYKNIDEIISCASKYDRHWNISGSPYESPYEMKEVKKKDEPIVTAAIQLIDELLSHDIFCKFIAKRHLALIMRSIDSAERTKLWDSSGYFFFNNMFKWLFEDSESLLSQELKGSGTSYSQPLSNHAFKASGIVEHYRIFQSYDLTTEKLKVETVRKASHGLELALKEYFKNQTSHLALSVAIKDLAGVVSRICRSLVGQKQETWNNPYQEVFNNISCFFGHVLPNTLPQDENDPSADDKVMNNRSLLPGIVNAIFDYLEGLSWLTNTKYARYEATHLFWLLWTDHSNQVTDKIRDTLYEKIKTRINENTKQYYPSMIKLLLSVYGFRFPSIGVDNKIGKFIQDKFYDEIAKIALSTDGAAVYFLPSNWKWDLSAQTITAERGQRLYPKQMIPEDK